MEPLPNLFQNGEQQVNWKELNPLQLVLHGAKLFSKVVVVEQESFQETNLGLASSKHILLGSWSSRDWGIITRFKRVNAITALSRSDACSTGAGG